MTIPAGFPYPLNQEVEIPLEQIIPNPDQPRKLHDKEAIQLLSASMRAKGQEVAARVRPLTEEEQTAHPGTWVILIGGHGRREAALLNQFKTLKCTVEDIAPGETLSTAARDNNMRPMHWWEWYLVIEGVNNTTPKSQRDLADELGQSQTRVNRALKITKVLNPAARALVQENLQKTLKNGDSDVITKNKAFSLTESHLLVLADLEDPGQVQQALQLVLDDYLPADQAQKLVEHIQAGNPTETFDPLKVTLKPKPVSEAVTSHPDTPPVSVQSTHSSTHSGTSQHVASAQTQMPTAPSTVHAASTGNKPDNPTEMGTGETLAWDTLAGISPIKKIKAKINKGERPTWGEALILGAHKLGQPLGKGFAWVGKHGLKRIFKGIHWLWKTLIESLKLVGLYPYVRAVFFLAVCLLAGWCVWDGYHNGFWHPVKVVGARLHLPFLKAKEPPPTEAEKPATQPAEAVIPVVHTQPLRKVDSAKKSSPQTSGDLPAISSPRITTSPWSEEQESKNDLDFEIATVRANTRIMPFAFEPTSVDNAMAGQRLQDLADPDKYTLRRGSETDKVLGVSLLSTNLIVTCQSTDTVGSFLNGSGKVSFYWEDVKAIHVNELDTFANGYHNEPSPSGDTLAQPNLAARLVGSQQVYQCSVIADDTKEPFTVQCRRVEDLKHLVSALEFWIKTAQGKYAPLTGMPYPLQGLRLSAECSVEKLWADSPADKAGLQLGDHLWSVGKATKDQQEKKDFEKVFESAQVPITLYVASPADWNKAKIAAGVGSNDIHPRLRKIIFSEP